MTRTRIISLVVFCLYIAAVCYLCFAKPDNIPVVQFSFFGLPIDRPVHFLMFLPFPLLAFNAFDSEGAKVGRRALLISGIAAAGMALAVMTEYIQGLLAYRSQDAYDLLSDFLGLSTGVVIVIVYMIFRKLR